MQVGGGGIDGGNVDGKKYSKTRAYENQKDGGLFAKALKVRRAMRVRKKAPPGRGSRDTMEIDTIMD